MKFDLVCLSDTFFCDSDSVGISPFGSMPTVMGWDALAGISQGSSRRTRSFRTGISRGGAEGAESFFAEGWANGTNGTNWDNGR